MEIHGLSVKLRKLGARRLVVNTVLLLGLVRRSVHTFLVPDVVGSFLVVFSRLLAKFLIRWRSSTSLEAPAKANPMRDVLNVGTTTTLGCDVDRVLLDVVAGWRRVDPTFPVEGAAANRILLFSSLQRSGRGLHTGGGSSATAGERLP